MKKLSVLLLALLLVFAFASCGVIELPANTDAAQAALDAAFSEKEFEVTKDFTLDKTLVDAVDHEYEIVWTASNENATVVDGTDKVTVKVTQSLFEDLAFALTGTVTEGDVTASVTLNYTVPGLQTEGAKLLNAALEATFPAKYVETRDNFTLPAKVVDANGNEYALTWKSSDESVIKLNGVNATVFNDSYYNNAYATLTGTATKGDVTADVVINYAVLKVNCAHEYEITLTVAQNCGVDGYQAYECKHCHRTYMETLFATGDHDFEFVETVPAQDMAHGYDYYVCTVCGAEKQDNITHTYIYPLEQVDPTCTEDGYVVLNCYVCARNGVYEYIIETLPATGVHEYTELVEVTLEPTCTEAGSAVCKCKTCELTETVTIDALGHVDTDDCICDREGCDVEVIPETGSLITIKQALYIAAKQAHNTYLDANKYMVTGKIVEIEDASWGNLYIEDEEGNQLYIYGVYSVNGNVGYSKLPVIPAVGDTITLYGAIGRYNNTLQMKSGWLVHECERAEGTFACVTACTICGDVDAHEGGTATCIAKAVCTVCGNEYGLKADHVWGEDNKCTTEGCDEVKVTKLSNATLSFANKAQRTEFTSSVQVWEQNGVTVINNKSVSTSNVADYGNPARFYASTEIIVKGAGMTTIVFDCNNSTYATALKNSIGTVTGATVTVNDDKVTVTFTDAVEVFTIAKLTAQVRMDSITVNP